jgi:hypothetical protein
MSASTAFLSGWRSLPDELKLQIIKYALPAGDEYDEYTLERWLYSYKRREEVHNHGTPLTHTSKPSPASQWCKIGGRPGVVRCLSPFYTLLSVPELKGLALEAVCSQNTTYLTQGCKYGGPRWPPQDVRGYVRRLEIKVHCYEPSMIDFLNKVASDMSGLNHLHHTKLILKGYPDQFITDVMDVMDPIEFPTRVLEVSLHHVCGTTCEKLEGSWLGKLTVRGDQSKTTVRLERYFISMWSSDPEEDPQEFVEDWPAIMPDDAWRCMDRVVSI